MQLINLVKEVQELNKQIENIFVDFLKTEVQPILKNTEYVLGLFEEKDYIDYYFGTFKEGNFKIELNSSTEIDNLLESLDNIFSKEFYEQERVIKLFLYFLSNVNIYISKDKIELDRGQINE